MTSKHDLTDDFPHEEYGLLLQLTAPGTTRKFRDKASISRMDLIMADDMCETRPSGIMLPKILRKKLLLSQQQTQNEVEEGQDKLQDSTSGTTTQPDPTKSLNLSAASQEGTGGASHGADVNNPNMIPIHKRKTLLEQMDEFERTPLVKRVAYHDISSSNRRLSNSSPVNLPDIDNIVYDAENEVDNLDQYLPEDYVVPESYRNMDSSHVFTTSDLEKKLAQANAALMNIQKQLVRGEELYYQETDAHGNMYKGWDNFIDVKSEQMGIPNYEIGSSTSDPKEKRKVENTTNAPIRRMHNDLRWFSSSSSLADGVGRLGKTDRKRSRRSLSSSASTSSILGGRSSRELKKETSSNVLAVSPAASDHTPNVDANLGNSRSEPKQMEVKKAVKIEVKEEEPIPKKQKLNRESSVNISPPPEENHQKKKKADPPTAEEEAQMKQKIEEDSKGEKNTEKMKIPKDAPSVEDIKVEESASQVSKKRKTDALSPETAGEEFRDDDNDSTSKKARPRKRKK